MSCATLGPLVARKVVHDDDVALRERGREAFLHPLLERSRVDGVVESLLRHEPGQAQAGDQCDRLIVAMRHGGAQPATAPAAPALARHGRGRAGFVDEHQLGRIEVELLREPGLALLQNVCALLLLRMRGLFLNVIPCRSKNRQITEEEKRSPQLAISRAWISSNVMSGWRRLRPSR